MREIESREGIPTLERLDDLSDEDADAYLRSLPGVGPKTAACVLLFSLRRPAFPVDTHVHRVARRLGLIGPATTPEIAHRELGPAVPPDIRYSFHVGLIRHGRKVCKPRLPHCSECALFDMCAAGPQLLKEGAGR